MPVFQGFREFCQPLFCELKNQKLLDLPSLLQSYAITFVLFKMCYYITEVCYLKKYFLPLKNFLYETKACNKNTTANNEKIDKENKY